MSNVDGVLLTALTWGARDIKEPFIAGTLTDGSSIAVLGRELAGWLGPFEVRAPAPAHALSSRPPWVYVVGH